MTPAQAAATLARRLELAADGAMSVRDAAAFSGIGRTELFELIRRGELVALKHGARRLIPRRALVEFLAALMPTA